MTRPDPPVPPVNDPLVPVPHVADPVHGMADDVADDPVTTGVATVDDGEVLADLEFPSEDDQHLEGEFGPAPRIVVFDVGEVLIDETRVWATWAELLGTTPLTLAAALGAAVAQGLDHVEAFAHVAPNIAWEDFVTEFERRYGGFREEDLYMDVRPCLAELDDAGIRVVIAGNQPAARTQQLRALELPCHALAMSDDLGHDKPDPAFFDAVLALAGASDPGQVLYVGDRVDNDVLPAAAAGLHTCWLRRGPWGVLQDLPDGTEADLVLDGLGELPLLLAEWGGPQDS